MDEKFYEGSSLRPEAEVSGAQAGALRTYTKAYYGPHGAIERTELHDSGRVVEVNYYQASDPAAISSSHSSDYPGVRFRLWRTTQTLPGFVWKFVRAYDATGAPDGYSRVLTDDQGRELMQMDLDESRRVMRTAKYAWDDGGDLRYAFEYNDAGVLVDGLDLLYGDRASVEDVTREHPGSSFFQDAQSLPAAIAAAGVPPDPL
jgi:hypothetical protein